MDKIKIRFEFEISEKLCKDEVVGTLEYNISDDKYEFKLHDKYDETIIRNKSDYCKYYPNHKKYLDLVVILESPHIDEFKSKAKDRLENKYRPANGVTGKKFKENFATIINNEHSSKLMKNNYIVHIVNSIQYQCSLGIKPIYFRDYVWLTLWKQENIRKSFRDRINTINPIIIINCCTQGKHTRGYKDNCFLMEEQSLDITEKYLKELGYKIENDKVDFKSKLVKYDGDTLLKYNKADEITLKNFVEYQLPNTDEDNYIKLNHPVTW